MSLGLNCFSKYIDLPTMLINLYGKQTRSDLFLSLIAPFKVAPPLFSLF